MDPEQPGQFGLGNKAGRLGGPGKKALKAAPGLIWLSVVSIHVALYKQTAAPAQVIF